MTTTEPPFSYWDNRGKFQKAYTFFYDKLVPARGNAETPSGNLLRIVSKMYYRNCNDGDSYYDMTDEQDGMFRRLSDCSIGVDIMFLYTLEHYLLDENYEQCVNEMMIYIMMENSTPDQIWNPLTNRLVKINGATGLKCLKMLGCKLEYSRPV